MMEYINQQDFFCVQVLSPFPKITLARV